MRAILVLLFLPLQALAELDVRLSDADMFPDSVSYRADIPTPEDFLGFKLGHEPVRHHQLVDYLRLVASLSDRLTVETIGYSHERRPILFLTATSDGNRERIDEIKAAHSRISNGETDAKLAADAPVVTWLNYGVHGAESSGMDSVLPFVYYLAAAEGAEMDQILESSVILVTAIFNPDGHAKRIAWFDAYGGVRRIADPAHIEHQFSWSFARTNHYWFDLNRQWLLLTQPEARAWMSKWHEWRPNLTVDYHEMGPQNTYYFHPGVRTRTNPLALDVAEALMAKTAEFSEDVLDAEGRLYYHGERFDNYYAGKGSTFPLLNGGVGILYEAGAALGREIDTASGLRTFRENIRKQFRTSIASIRAASTLRSEYQDYQRQFYASAFDTAEADPTQAWIFSAGRDVERIRAFVETLETHRIAVEQLAEDIEVDGSTFAAGHSFVVRTNQAQYRLIRSIFETQTEFEDATFYDVSTWTMPLAFDLDYATVDARTLRRMATRSELIFSEPAEVEFSNYAYVLEWSPYFSARALNVLLEAGLLARGATKNFEVMTTNGPKAFAPGDVVIPVDRQLKDKQALYALIREASEAPGVQLHAMTSGKSLNGTEGVNVGGPSFEPIVEPKTLLLVGDRISRYDSGEIWHLLDFRMQIPVSLRDLDTLSGVDLNDYTHIVFPSGDYSFVDAELKNSLVRWIHAGGTAVAFRGAATFLQTSIAQFGMTPEELEAANLEEEVEPEKTRYDYSSKEQRDAVDVLGGAIFSGDLDISHPIGFGYLDRSIALHKNYEEVFELPENPYATVIAYSEKPLISGYASAANIEKIAGSPAILAERQKRGSTILFADNPNFRGYWYGTNKLFLNTLFYSKAFSAPSD